MVSSVKLLGLNISNNFKWNCHVSEISRKVSTKLYFLKQLKRVNVEIKDQVTFFFHRPPPCHRICLRRFPQLTPQLYFRRARNPIDACHANNLSVHHLPESSGATNLETLFDRRQALTTKLFQHISSNPSRKLYKLLPEANKCCYSLRNNRKFQNQETT